MLVGHARFAHTHRHRMERHHAHNVFRAIYQSLTVSTSLCLATETVSHCEREAMSQGSSTQCSLCAHNYVHFRNSRSTHSFQSFPDSFLNPPGPLQSSATLCSSFTHNPGSSTTHNIISGFVWPSAAPGALQSPTVSVPSGDKSSTSSAMSHSGKSQSTAIVNTTTISTKGRKPIHVRVTHTVTVSPHRRKTAHVQVTHTVTVGPHLTMTAPVKATPPYTEVNSGHSDGLLMLSAPRQKTPSADPTGVVFTLYTPPADPNQVENSKSGGTNHAAIIGGISGVVILAVVALVAFVVFRNKRKSAPDAESGRARPHDTRTTHEVINDAIRIRNECHRRHREPVNHSYA